MERRSEPLLFSGRMLKENKRGRVSREELCEPWNKTKLQKSWEQEKQNETLSAEKIMLKGPISWGSWNIGVLREGSVLEEEGKILPGKSKHCRETEGGGQLCLCSPAHVHLHKEKGTVWLHSGSPKKKLPQGREKDTHQTDLALAVLTMFLMFVFGGFFFWFGWFFFPCVVQTSLILKRVLSFHCSPCSWCSCQHLLP